MGRYPKPPSGGLSGGDGDMLRQGSAGHLGWNPNTETGEKMACDDRRNAQENDGDYFSSEDGE